MPLRVRVLLTPHAAPISPRSVAVIVDVLRATSTLSFALANGAQRVVPVATPEQALERRRQEPDALLCGERGGKLIPGFDLGNSPTEYTAPVVGGRTLIFASTNGSIAMLAAQQARRRILGAFVNATAVLKALQRESHVAIVCAGKLGEFSLEDAAFAGWLASALEQRSARLEGADSKLATALAPRDADEVRAILQGSSHGRYLVTLGPEFRADVERCAEVDVLDRAFEI